MFSLSLEFSLKAVQWDKERTVQSSGRSERLWVELFVHPCWGWPLPQVNSIDDTCTFIRNTPFSLKRLCIWYRDFSLNPPFGVLTIDSQNSAMYFPALWPIPTPSARWERLAFLSLPIEGGGFDFARQEVEVEFTSSERTEPVKWLHTLLTLRIDSGVDIGSELVKRYVWEHQKAAAASSERWWGESWNQEPCLASSLKWGRIDVSRIRIYCHHFTHIPLLRFDFWLWSACLGRLSFNSLHYRCQLVT